MKIGIITFHFVNNFGGVLQTYALNAAVEKYCDKKTIIIDYRNWFIRMTDLVRLFPITTDPRELISGLKTMGKRLSRRHKFGAFTRYNNNVSEKFLSYRKLRKYGDVADKYICGSDQIWNPCLTGGVSKPYFLCNILDSSRKIAYAPSFGTDGVAKRYEKEIKEYIEAIDFLSIREKTGVEYVKKLLGKKQKGLLIQRSL